MNNPKKAKNKLYLYILVIVGYIFSIFFLGWWFLNNILPIYLSIFIVPFIVFYTITQIHFLWYIYLKIDMDFENGLAGNEINKDPFTVDVFLPVYKEPLWLVEKSLQAMVNLKYTHKTYLLDDNQNQDYKSLAERLGAIYISRINNDGNKAGNINHALDKSKGELIAIFDVDHIPQENYLDKVINFFKDPMIGFVQVAIDHSNMEQSFVAKSFCKMNDNFFKIILKGMRNCDCAVAFGSNSIFRREALLSIGGYKIGLAEDLFTSINIHAKGWHSEYVPESLAKGLSPEDLISFFKQQFKWAYGVFEVLFKAYPGLIKKLSAKQNICYLNRMTYYLAGPFIFVNLILTMTGLFYHTINNELSIYITISLMFLFVFLLIQEQIKKMYFREKYLNNFNIRGLLLTLASWPIYTIAFISLLMGVKVSFIATPKEMDKRPFLKYISPQIIVCVTLLSGILFNIFSGNLKESIVVIIFALLFLFMHSGLLWSYLINANNSKISALIVNFFRNLNFNGNRKIKFKQIL